VATGTDQDRSSGTVDMQIQCSATTAEQQHVTSYFATQLKTVFPKFTESIFHIFQLNAVLFNLLNSGSENSSTKMLSRLREVCSCTLHLDM
jgi:hypothetical protein